MININEIKQIINSDLSDIAKEDLILRVVSSCSNSLVRILEFERNRNSDILNEIELKIFNEKFKTLS